MPNETKVPLVVRHASVQALEDGRNTVIRAETVIGADGRVRHVELQFLQASQTRGEEPHRTHRPMAEIRLEFLSLEALKEQTARLLGLRPASTGSNGNGRADGHIIELRGQGVLVYLDSRGQEGNDEPARWTLRMINKHDPAVNLAVGAYGEVVEEVCEALARVITAVEAECEKVRHTADLEAAYPAHRLLDAQHFDYCLHN